MQSVHSTLIYPYLFLMPLLSFAVEELTCLATWKDGNSRYLVGLVSHHHAISNEERFRCFVYEKISSLMGKKIFYIFSSLAASGQPYV